MNPNNYFDITRFWLLLRMELHRSRKGIVMTIVIALGLLFFFGLLMTPVFEPGLLIFTHHEGYAFTLLIGGFILSSLAFTDLSNSLKRFHYLTLPVSTFERFLCMWLLTLVGWILVYSVIYYVYTLFANQVGQILYPHLTFVAFKPLGTFSINVIKYYFVLQGIFLIGAVHFKGYVFPKTLFALVIAAIITMTIGYLLVGDLLQSDGELCLSESDALESMTFYKIWMVLQWLFWWVLAPLSWVIIFIGLKEKEV